MPSSRDRDNKGTEKGQKPDSRKLIVGVGGQFVTVNESDLPAVLGDDPTGAVRQAFEELCEAGCDRAVLIYALKVIRNRLPSYWSQGEESEDEVASRAQDADTLERAARVVEQRYAPFLPTADMTEEHANNVKAWDEWSLAMGGVGPVRLLGGLLGAAEKLRGPEQFRQAAELRTNQNDFDVSSRYVLCAFVHESTRAWHDREVSTLLSQIGNFKADGRQAVLDAEALRQWRATNVTRLERTFRSAVEQLYSLRAPQADSSD